MARHLQADIHTMREEAVIILSLHLVHGRRLVEADDVGNPTRQLIGSRGLACTRHLIQDLKQRTEPYFAGRTPLAGMEQRTAATSVFAAAHLRSLQ